MIRENIRKFKEDDDVDLNSRTILSHEQMDWLKEIETASDRVISPLQEMEDQLHPLTDYLIVPLFAFANAGIFLLDINPATVVTGISLAILLSLVVGKFAGILLFSWASVKLGIAPMPERANWRMMSAISLLGGIGFTVSLFIASLTFDTATAQGAAMLNDAKLGIVAGSLIAGLGGYILLKLTLPAAADQEESKAQDAHESK